MCHVDPKYIYLHIKMVRDCQSEGERKMKLGQLSFAEHLLCSRCCNSHVTMETFVFQGIGDPPWLPICSLDFSTEPQTSAFAQFQLRASLGRPRGSSNFNTCYFNSSLSCLPHTRSCHRLLPLSKC